MSINIETFPQVLQQVQAEVEKVVYGAKDHVRVAMIALMVKGHMLLEGPPGVAKTLLVRTFAQVLGLKTKRLQCTPDLMPGDVLGANIFDFRTQNFHLTKGPVFTEFLLADEINRTPPKTQAALLEAMQERSATIDGTTHKLSDFFMIMATQNPLEHEGTYPLPEAQLDRFLFKLHITYPNKDDELQAVLAHCKNATMPDITEMGIQTLFNEELIQQLQAIPSQVHVEPNVADYAVRLARATRENHSLFVGMSPRATTMLVAASRAAAACEGRSYIVPDDIKALFLPAVQHRIILATGAEMEGRKEQDILKEILQQTPVPR